MDNNPNMIDSLFVPERCVLHSSKIGEMVRETRKIFLHKGSFHKLKGYAYSQLSKMKGKNILKFVKFCKKHNISTNITKDEIGETALDLHEQDKLRKILNKIDTNNRNKRLQSIEKYGLDIKFAYHIVRLINQAEQILTEHDLDITRNREQLKSIRRGEWSADRIEKYFYMREEQLENIYMLSQH